MRYLYSLFMLFPVTLVAQSNVGIGTQTPLSKLDIMATGDGVELLRFSTERPWIFKQNGSGSSTRLSLQSTVDSKNFEILSQDGMNRSAVFFTHNIHSNVLLVPDMGEVGVGIPEDPMGKLHIRHNSNTVWPQLRLTEDENDFARIKLESSTDPGIFWDIAGRADSIETNSRLNFYYANPGFTGDKMTIMGNGNVGIGNTNPQAKLDILGGDWNLGAGNPGDLRIGNPTYNLRIGVATGGGGAGTGRIFTQGGGLFLGTNNSSHLSITTDGEVGIGTTNPTEKLDIVGSFRVSDLAGSGDRNVIVDANGKFKIGTVGVGDTDWVETADQVSTTKRVYVDAQDAAISSLTVVGRTSNGDNFAALSLYNDAVFPGGTYRRLLLDANDIDAFRGTGTTPIHESLSIQRLSNGNLYLTNGGGKVGIGTTSPGSRLSVNGVDNNGAVATLELTSGSQKMLIDGNEIDATGTTNGLFLNANSGLPVSVGTLSSATGYKLAVAGKIIAEEVRVQLAGDWPDYVFQKDYPLMPLDKVQDFISENHHLPGVPSALMVHTDGIALGEMQTKTIEKIEELTLYILQLNERLSTLEKENRELRNALSCPDK